MPTLDWIGKKAVVNHHRQVPFRLLKCDEKLSVGDPDSGNLLIQGDNLEALKALLPYYAGQVKCIYIDPPYNTGKEGWVYNDNVNSPEIRRWLGKVVGKEAEDLDRHDKWACMMYPRLRLLREFLQHDGVIFISIGKDEFGHLRLMCDEIFGARNLLEAFIWQIEGNVENQEAVTSVHEYILAYERMHRGSRIQNVVDPNVDDDSKLRRDFAENSVVKNGPANPASVIQLPAGFPCAVERLLLRKHDFAHEFIERVESDQRFIRREMRQEHDVAYPIRLDDMMVEGGVLTAPCRVYSGWSSARKFGRFITLGCEPLDEEDGSKLTYFLSHTGVPTYKRLNRRGHFVPTILRNMGTVERAANELERMGVHFTYPKPVQLIKYLIALYAEEHDLVLDSFCGSGTTGHAVSLLNSSTALDLRYILVELESVVAENSTAKRLRSVVEGYQSRRGKSSRFVEGSGGGFRFCTLGKPLFDEHGNIADYVRFSDLAAHVFFTETGVPIPKIARSRSPLLGVHDGKAVYLLFNGLWGTSGPTGETS